MNVTELQDKNKGSEQNRCFGEQEEHFVFSHDLLCQTYNKYL